LRFYKDFAPTALRQVADDEAASGAPERFAFRQRANIAQAFGHAAQAGAKYQCPSHARIFKGMADDSPSPSGESLISIIVGFKVLGKMSEAVTWIDVTDTAVKIGLSGIIVAISGYFLAQRNQRHDFDKEYFRRRQDVIEGVAAKFASIHAFFFKVCIDYMALVELLHAGFPASDSDREKFYSYGREIGEKLHEMHILEGKLLVAGANEATRVLQQYRLQATEVNDMIKLQLPAIKKNEVETITNKLFRRKDTFYKELAEAFKTI